MNKIQTIPVGRPPVRRGCGQAHRVGLLDELVGLGLLEPLVELLERVLGHLEDNICYILRSVIGLNSLTDN